MPAHEDVAGLSVETIHCNAIGLASLNGEFELAGAEVSSICIVADGGQLIDGLALISGLECVQAGAFQ